ncbi:MAG: HAMP domain-containing sensor histidine kinase [Pseudoflavonifractor sp.]|nr:HAMP domain-containing sensor histidine kinase [Pseudoflavonifractor sp.]
MAWDRQGRSVPVWRSLQSKFILSYGAIIIALILFLNTYPILISQNLVFRSKQDSLWRQADLITSTLAGSEGLTAEGVEANLTQLGVIDATRRVMAAGVDRVMVTDPAGLVLFDTSEVDNAKDKYGLLWEVVSALRGEDVFRCEYREDAFRSRAAVPIRYRGMTQGAVYLYEYDEEQAGMLVDFQKNLRNISIVICVVTLLFSLLFSTAVTRRIAVLLRGIRTVREGEYSHRVSMSGGDELTQLADEFNALTGRLQTTEEVRRRFVSDASHELKTPLASIRLLTDSILQAEHMDGSTAREFVADIGEEAERLTRITEKLLTLTRMDTMPPVVREPVDLKQVVLRVEHMLTPLAGTRQVSFRMDLAGYCTVLANEDDLYQVTFNLVENAIKYNVPGGTVMVSLFLRRGRNRGDGDLVVLRVEDTGVGIPEEDMPKIFDRFYRVDKARSREAGGTGLGLSIVRDMVRQHGGTVEVRRRMPEGTCFEVVFPRWQPEQKEEKP